MTNSDHNDKVEKKPETPTTAAKDFAITKGSDSAIVRKEQDNISDNPNKTPSEIHKALHGTRSVQAKFEIADTVESNSIHKLEALGTPEAKQFAELRREIRRNMPPGAKRDKIENATKIAIEDVLQQGRLAHIPSDDDGGTHMALGFKIILKGDAEPLPKQTITVRKDETLSTIATFILGKDAPPEQIKSFIQDTAKLNHLSDPTAKLHAGDTLGLPSSSVQKDKTSIPSEKSELLNSATSPETYLEQQRISLLRLASEKGINLADNIRQIESMHSPEESSETFKHVNRILLDKSDNPLTLDQKKLIAEQIIHHAAHPTEINQGNHKTCNVNTVECRTYTKTPACAAKMVADVVLDGRFVSPHGVTVQLSPYTFDSESSDSFSSMRTHASEIFQRTAINLHYELASRYNGHNIRYIQLEAPGKDDTGERLIDYTKNGKVIEKSPHLEDHVLCEISNLITGKSEKGILICNERNYVGAADSGMTLVSSEHDLGNAIKRLKAEHKLPAIVRVDCTSEPFFSDSGGGVAGGSGGAHVVTILDMVGSPPRVMIDNQWGSSSDHLKDGGIPLHDLYIATLEPADAAAELRKDVMKNRAHGHIDSYKEFDLLRMEYAGGIIPDQSTLEKQLSSLMKSQSEVWHQQDKHGHLNKADKEKALDLIEQLVDGGINSLSAKARTRVLENSLGLISNGVCDVRLMEIGEKLAANPKRSKSDVHEFLRLLKTLPKSRSTKILKETRLH